MSNSIAPGSLADVNVKVTALTTNPNVPVTYKTIILKKNLVNGINTLTQEMISNENIKYVIKYDYVLSEDITIPENCILEFDGGSINGEHIITGNNSVIIGSIIYNKILCCIDGTFTNEDGFRIENYTKRATKYRTKIYGSISSPDMDLTAAKKVVNNFKNNLLQGMVVCIGFDVAMTDNIHTLTLRPVFGKTSYKDIISVIKELDFPLGAIKIHGTNKFYPYHVNDYSKKYIAACKTLIQGLHNAGLNELTNTIYVLNENYLLYSEYFDNKSRQNIEDLLSFTKNLGYNSAVSGFDATHIKTPVQNLDIVGIHWYPKVNPSILGYSGFLYNNSEQVIRLDCSHIYQLQGNNIKVYIDECGCTGNSYGLRRPGSSTLPGSTSNRNIYDSIGVKSVFFRSALPIIFDNNIETINLWYIDTYYDPFMTSNSLKKVLENIYYLTK